MRRDFVVGGMGGGFDMVVLMCRSWFLFGDVINYILMSRG